MCSAWNDGLARPADARDRSGVAAVAVDLARLAHAFARDRALVDARAAIAETRAALEAGLASPSPATRRRRRRAGGERPEAAHVRRLLLLSFEEERRMARIGRARRLVDRRDPQALLAVVGNAGDLVSPIAHAREHDPMVAAALHGVERRLEGEVVIADVG